jgi:uncharacterized protein
VNTSLSHLPEHKQKQLKEIAAIIVKAVDPEKVILFGSHATGRWVEHRYTEGGSLTNISATTISYYQISAEELSLLIERVGKLQSIVERICQEKIASFGDKEP